jgi:purine-binding chemotaxis protein CheW
MAANGVAEIIRMPRITRLPNGPAALLGVIHLRGTILPVLSLHALLGDAQPAGAAHPGDVAQQGGKARIVVLRQDPPLGLAVDAVEALQKVAEGAVLPAAGRLLLEGDGAAEWLELGPALRERFAAAFGHSMRPATGPAAAPAMASAPAAQDQAFLALTLAGQAFALPLEAVTEVLALPPALSALPQTETMLLGVFTLRNAVLPALSLRILLGLPDRQATGGEQVVVTEVAGQRLALVVDRIGSILRVAPDRVGPAPRLFNKGGGEARVDRVLRQADGRGLVAILSPGRILADERVAQLLAGSNHEEDAAMVTPAVPQREAGARRERFVVIRLGTESYGLPIAAVDEVVRLPETLTRLPKAPDYVRGVLNLRGRVIPVIDQRVRFAVGGENGRGTQAPAGRIVVMTLGKLQAGFAVDAVSDILEAEPGEVLPAPEWSKGGARLFDRAVTIQRAGQLILLIDPAALLDMAEADLLRGLAADASGP